MNRAKPNVTIRPPSGVHCCDERRTKRRGSAALQDAGALAKARRASARFWSAPVLRRFGSEGNDAECASAFTLIELLIVIAVVAILTSLLLPALGHSQSQARRIRCVGNLRQIGIATQLYWDDYEGQAFRYRRAVEPSGALYWFGWIERGSEGNRTFDATQGALFPYLGKGTVEICPSLNYALESFKRKATGAAYGYGYNLQLSASDPLPPVRLSSIPNPAQVVVLADAAQVNTFQSPASPDNPMLEEFYYVNTNEPTVHFRHSQRANLVFVDGHVDKAPLLPGSIDARLPRQYVGQLPPELLRLQAP